MQPSVGLTVLTHSCLLRLGVCALTRELLLLAETSRDCAVCGEDEEEEIYSYIQNVSERSESGLAAREGELCGIGEV